MSDKIINTFDVWITAQGLKSKGRVSSIENISLEGITRLRELILELAIQGKLVPQDSTDEPASVLLKKMAEEEEDLVSKKLIKKPKDLPPVSKEEFPFKLPAGWEFTRLNCVGEWGAGATPLRSRSDYYGGGIPWFKSGELSSDFIDSSEETVTDLALKETSLRYNKVGDVLIAMYGATIGKASILKIRATTNQAVCACTPFNGLYNVFLLYLLKAYNKRFVSMGAGGAQPNISREKIIATVIPLPPYKEQQRIVSKVDELMAFCDRLEEHETKHLESHQLLVKTLLATLTSATDTNDFVNAWAKLEAHFDELFTTEDSIEQLKQTVLQLAVMGKLVPQDQNEESASELLKKIAGEKERLVEEGKARKVKEHSHVAKEEYPFDLPVGWAFVRLGNIAEVNPRNDVADETEASFIPMSMVSTSHKGEHETETKLWRDIKKGFTHFADGDIGIAKITPCFENSKAIVLSDLKNGIGAGTTELLIARPYGRTLEPRYILLYLKSPEYLELGESKMTGTAGQKRLPRSFFENNPLPLPPLAEQKRIVNKVDEVFSLCDALKASVIRSGVVVNQMSDSMIEQIA